MADRWHRWAAVVSVGDELTLGQTLDTNSRWLSRALLDAGVVVREHATVGDDLDAMVRTLRRLVGGVDLVIVTGGLGPTDDDLTREAVAVLLGEPLVEDGASVAHLRSWFAGRAMPEKNLVQALRPRSASALPNPHGTAPGLWARVPSDGDVVDLFCLPGPPREMNPMFAGEVLTRLRRPPGEAVVTRVRPTFGLGESEIARRLGDLMDRAREGRGEPLVGTTASQGVVSIRIRARGPDATARADATEAQCVDRVGAPWVIGSGEVSLAECVLDLLRGSGRTLAVAESCTGGLLGSMLTEVAGASDVFLGGWITYADRMKAVHLGVPEGVLADHGAVSAPTAMAMAQGARRASGASHALAITGVAGPGGGTPAKPVGTVWVAVASEGAATAARRFALAGDRTNIRTWAAQSALGILRLRLIGREDLDLSRQAERAEACP